MTTQELIKLITRLRNGEKVVCPLCQKGILIPTGNPKTTHGFHCDKCGKRLNIN